MNADEIRSLNHTCQKECNEAATSAERQAGMDSLMASLLAEIAAQLAQLNAGLETITGYQTLKVQIEPGQYPIVVEEKK
jgi:hypothetical protein